jgi:hypothetical protein
MKVSVASYLLCKFALCRKVVYMIDKAAPCTTASRTQPAFGLRWWWLLLAPFAGIFLYFVAIFGCIRTGPWRPLTCFRRTDMACTGGPLGDCPDDAIELRFWPFWARAFVRIDCVACAFAAGILVALPTVVGLLRSYKLREVAIRN